jgi:hypothetical protein
LVADQSFLQLVTYVQAQLPNLVTIGASGFTAQVAQFPSIAAVAYTGASTDQLKTLIMEAVQSVMKNNAQGNGANRNRGGNGQIAIANRNRSTSSRPPPSGQGSCYCFLHGYGNHNGAQCFKMAKDRTLYTNEMVAAVAPCLINGIQGHA